MNRMLQGPSANTEETMETPAVANYKIQIALLEAHNQSRLEQARTAPDILSSDIDLPMPPPPEDWTLLPESGTISNLMATEPDMSDGLSDMLFSSHINNCTEFLWGGAANPTFNLDQGSWLPTHGLPSAIFVPGEGGNKEAFQFGSPMSPTSILPTSCSSPLMDWALQGFQQASEKPDAALAATNALRITYRSRTEVSVDVVGQMDAPPTAFRPQYQRQTPTGDRPGLLISEPSTPESMGPSTPSSMNSMHSCGGSFVVVGEEDELPTAASSCPNLVFENRRSSSTKKGRRQSVPMGLSSSRVRVSDKRVEEMVSHGRLKTHKSPSGQFKCRHCPNRNQRFEHLKRHEDTHLPDHERKWWGCPFGCEGAMNRKDNMKEHIRRRNCPKAGDLKKRAGDLGLDWIQLCKSEKGRKEITQALGMKPDALEPVYPVGPPAPKKTKGGKR